MKFPHFPQLHGAVDRNLLEFQSNFVGWLWKLRAMPFLGGNDLTSELDANGNSTDGIAFTAAVQKTVPHKLGKTPVKCFVTRCLSGGTSFAETATADATYVYLTFASTSKVYLRVE